MFVDSWLKSATTCRHGLSGHWVQPASLDRGARGPVVGRARMAGVPGAGRGIGHGIAGLGPARPPYPF